MGNAFCPLLESLPQWEPLPQWDPLPQWEPLPHSTFPMQPSFVNKVISRLPGTKQPSKITHLEKYVYVPFYPCPHLLSTTRKTRVVLVPPSLKFMHVSHRLCMSCINVPPSLKFMHV